ncbi:MAG TPA: hypothetical protein PK082_00835 [Phycisphaerae bacterium]|nr:hypothetical protein [Phycisphaerae bacterium]
MTGRRGVSIKAVLTALLAAGALAALVVVVVRSDLFGERGREKLGPEFQYDLDSLRRIDPARIGWRQTASFPAGVASPAALAVGADGRIYVAGGDEVRVFSPAGLQESAFRAGAAVAALAAGDDGRIYLAAGRRVEVRDGAGVLLTAWSPGGETSLPKSIAVHGESVAVADLGLRAVLVFDRQGALQTRLDGTTRGETSPWLLPGPCFALTFGRDGLLRIVNPGQLRIEAWTTDGHREFVWGRAATDLDGFLGCCNPVYLAVLDDGRIVTSEKGVRRIKVYRPDGPRGAGKLESVVAGPAQLGNEDTALPVAADAQGRIYALDPTAGRVRVFESIAPASLPAGGRP